MLSPHISDFSRTKVKQDNRIAIEHDADGGRPPVRENE
jgi:hypothetical protein